MEQCDNYEIFDDFKPAEEQNCGSGAEVRG